MGNKITTQREFIEERYTRPQGSFEYKDGDSKKLRRLILNGQLAPCYPGVEEYAPELDECPICFLFFPSLNRSRCCSKSVCTECYLQIKSSGYAPFTNCPFCKAPNYIVEYRGAKTAEEKYFEQAEEQKVIEAKIRIHQKEVHDEEDRLLRRGEDRPAEEEDLVSMREHAVHADNYDIQHLNQLQEPFEHDEIQLFGQHGFEEECFPEVSFCHSSGDDEIGLDMEEVMLMKAIWLSIQDQRQRNQESSIPQQTFHNNAMKEFGLRRRKGRRYSGSGDSPEIRGKTVASGSGSLLDHATFAFMAPADSGERSL
ncbi:hypothetical protein GOP47_0006251 [Adiantum capillus-veneris]|uniref:RING-type domain-containing protein n=1 Tax=Adiantum capillus-veneris TaxID=13818 RepID=A0A9D4ZMV2_ADICA|nr:hypothetical protein GOP47_0006251 [Adiantum capillus-veneris]